MYQLTSIFELASILVFVSLAAVLTFRLAGFPDLSVDGVFSLGAVVFAKCLLLGWGTPISFFCAMSAGACIGLLTASIADRLRINPLLASVLVLIILYSLNLRILGRANQPIFGALEAYWSIPGIRFGVFLLLVVIIFVIMVLFFKTEMGAALRCTGTSPSFLISVGKNVGVYRAILVSFAGCLVAMSGALLSLKFGFADVTLGTGTIIIGIASLIIGEKICGRNSLMAQLLCAPCGIIIYELAVGVALSSGISPIDVKLGTGVLTILLLALNHHEKDRLFA